MVKLTPDIIEGAGQYINPVRDRELDLRGYKVVFVIDKHFHVRCQDQDVEVNTLHPCPQGRYTQSFRFKLVVSYKSCMRPRLTQIQGDSNLFIDFFLR